MVTICAVVQQGGSEGDLLADIRDEPALIHPNENGTSFVLYCASLLGLPSDSTEVPS